MKKTILKYEGKGIEETQKWIDNNKDNALKQKEVTKMKQWVKKAQKWKDSPITVMAWE